MKKTFQTESIFTFDRTIKISQNFILNDSYLEMISPNLSQLKLFLYGLSLIENEQTEFTSVKLTSGMIAKVLGKKISGGQISSNIFSQLQNTEKVGTLEHDLSPLPMVVSKIFFEDFSCAKNPLSCEFTLANYLKPYLLGLDGKPCCLVKACYVRKFRSVSALKLYVYFNSLVNMKGYVTCIEKLIAMTNYRGRKDNFINRVLKPALDYINYNTNLTVVVNPIKIKQSVVGFLIKCELKNNWVVRFCGLESCEKTDCFDDVKKYLPRSSISNPIKFEELAVSQQNIIFSLRRNYIS